MQLVAADLLERLDRFLKSYSTLAVTNRLGVGVSGGADSMVLLHLLTELARQSGTQLTVLHVNHALRGAESEGDEQFVREVAGALGWPATVFQGPVTGGSIEAEARRIRHGFFNKARAELQLGYVALGHTATDQAETVLFRLLRGTGLTGLAGMAPVGSNRILRPLLTSTRDEVRAYGREHGVCWREDASNRDLRFRRNLLRLQVIPELARVLNPRLEDVLTRTATLARDEERYWRPRIQRQFRDARCAGSPPGIYLDVPRLRSMHVAVRRRVLRVALRTLRGDLAGIDARHVEATLRLLESSHGHDRVQIPGVDALRSFDVLRLTPIADSPQMRGYALPVMLGIALQLPANAGRILVRSLTEQGSDCVTVNDEEASFGDQTELDGEALDSIGGWSSLQIRNWQPGDSILLPGAHVPVKLKTLFQENRIVLWERRDWPVLAAGMQIVWTRQFGAASGFAASACSRWRLRIGFCSGSERKSDL